MRSIVGILGFLIFLLYVVLAAGGWIEGLQKGVEASCSPERKALGFCQK